MLEAEHDRFQVFGLTTTFAPPAEAESKSPQSVRFISVYPQGWSAEDTDPIAGGGQFAHGTERSVTAPVRSYQPGSMARFDGRY